MFRGTWKGTTVAVKTLRKSPYDQKILEELKKEVALMCTLRFGSFIFYSLFIILSFFYFILLLLREVVNLFKFF